MGKILAIDFGLKRTGLAISDDQKMFAFGLKTIGSSELEHELKQLINNESVDTIILGLPKRLNNEDTNVTENVRLLYERLQEIFPICKVELYDERFTSKMASSAIHFGGGNKKQKMDKSLIDKVSATIILQSYIESQGANKRFDY